MDDLSAVAALHDPVRRRLYEHVVAASEAVGREAAAAALEIPLHAARFHLERLAREGLLDVEYRRLGGRSGPGAGRPAKLYRAARREVSVSVPPRRYDLVGSVLAEAVARSLCGEDLAASVDAVARERGRVVGAQAPTTDQSTLERTAGALTTGDFETEIRDGVLRLRTCPFDGVATEQPALVCGLNVAYVDGVLAGLGADDATTTLDPEPGRCCVRVEAPGVHR